MGSKNVLTDYNLSLSEHREEFDAMACREKCFRRCSSGCFLLPSTMRMILEWLLNRYFQRTGMEVFFKTVKDCLDLLPLDKWNSQRMEEKILSDIIVSAVYVMMRKEANQPMRPFQN